MINIYTFCDLAIPYQSKWTIRMENFSNCKTSLGLRDVLDILMQGYEILQNRDIKSGKSSNFVLHENSFVNARSQTNFV